MPLVISSSDGDDKYAGVGAAVWASWLPLPLAAFTMVPQKIRDSDGGKGGLQNIVLVEGAGPMVLLCAFPKVMRNVLWAHIVDNEAAEAAFVKEASSLYEASHIVGLTLELCAKRKLILYFDRVESHANLVDGPSRGDMSVPWRKVEVVDFPVGDLEELAAECGGWILDPQWRNNVHP